jgi:hypothetical protein
MNLYDQTKGLWGTEAQALSARWVKCLTDALPNIKAASRRFHEWKPLRFYLSVTNALKPQVEFSLRFRGQEVATLTVPGNDPQLKFNALHRERNQRYFGVVTSAGTVSWVGPEAAQFRKAFKTLVSTKGGRVHSPEHEIESRILQDMEGGPSRFAGTLDQIQPVGLGGFPFQCPVPISASGGKPRAKRGNLDIVARRRWGARTILSIWELKAPHKITGAVEQVYIYAIVLALMLRGPNGDLWYRLFGFKGDVPQDLTIEAVVALTADQRRAAERAVIRLLAAKNPLHLADEGATIELSAAFYDPANLAIDLHRLA